MPKQKAEMEKWLSNPMRRSNLTPLDEIDGFGVRPGLYQIPGATAIPGGVNFTAQSVGATAVELLLFHRGEVHPYATLPFPDHYRIGNVYSMIVFDLDILEFEYAYRIDGPYRPQEGLLFNKQDYLLDPYAKAVTGQSRWGEKAIKDGYYRARVVEDDFDWGSFQQPELPISSLVIYEMHVRGFTRDASSGVKHPGTFSGVMEKIPYLVDLGVNAIELMPIFEFDEMKDCRERDGRTLIDYWGYNSVCFFAPNTSYTASLEYNREGGELKRLIKACNEAGIEVFLDVVFNHTAEGNELGPSFSFKGFDNNIYYMLTPDGHYYNFSGCGNTLNCNHPIVQDMILECLRHWVINYRVDGFRFDLASILGRNEDGSPMSKPPLLQALAFDPILGKVKLIAEAWDAGGLYQVGSFPSWNRWAEWNGKYRDDLRRFLKGDGGCAWQAAHRIAGSPDLYHPDHRGTNASVNFITCHDGFTLHDLYSYNQKHNEENGWGGTDGADDNNSWNCGAEGETDRPDVLALRNRMIKNACAVLLCSRGTPMFLMGDEFGNTQFGNNNPYCQDNAISWLNWDDLQKNRDIHAFFKRMIAFRHAHPVVREVTAPCICGFPSVSYHSESPWSAQYQDHTRVIAVMFAGRDETGHDDIVYIAVNAYWEPVRITLPELPTGYHWHLAVDTSEPERQDAVVGEYRLGPRSVAVFCGREKRS